MIDYLFVSLNKHRITAITDAENPASIALLERLGFRKEAHYLKNIFLKGSGAMSAALHCCNRSIFSSLNNGIYHNRYCCRYR
ncbi:GNAT family N-acetyltransferase [Vibrio lentus]|uniref:GNAT family N-acetyltransferase n=1 Tax=Vibrio lentus TaxID=136468 RepID=UPI0039A54D4F